jgi:hypothetical protein
MGWGFRKSVKFGPMRVNFSKSGIGVSAGVKGARVSVGSRGTYLNVGRGPFYYRQKLGGSARSQSGTVHLPQPEVVAELLPQDSPYQRPAFPEHGLPRIIHTLAWLSLFTLIIGLIVSYNPSRFSTSRSQTTSTPALNAVPAPSPALSTQTPRTSKRKSKRASSAQPLVAPVATPPSQVYDDVGQSSSASVPKPRSSSQSGLIRGPRGGCYYYRRVRSESVRGSQHVQLKET